MVDAVEKEVTKYEDNTKQTWQSINVPWIQIGTAACLNLFCWEKTGAIASRWIPMGSGSSAGRFTAAGLPPVLDPEPDELADYVIGDRAVPREPNGALLSPVRGQPRVERFVTVRRGIEAEVLLASGEGHKEAVQLIGGYVVFDGLRRGRGGFAGRGAYRPQNSPDIIRIYGNLRFDTRQSRYWSACPLIGRPTVNVLRRSSSRPM